MPQNHERHEAEGRIISHSSCRSFLLLRQVDFHKVSLDTFMVLPDRESQRFSLQPISDARPRFSFLPHPLTPHSPPSRPVLFQVSDPWSLQIKHGVPIGRINSLCLLCHPPDMLATYCCPYLNELTYVCMCVTPYKTSVHSFCLPVPASSIRLQVGSCIPLGGPKTYT